MNIKKNIFSTSLPLLFIVLFLTAGCHRKPSETMQETKTPADKTESSPLQKSTMVKKEVQFQQIPVQDKGALNQQSMSASPEPDYKSLYESGYEKHNAGDFKGAIADFDKCIGAKPDYADAYSFRGMSKYKSGDKAGACSDWNKAASLGNSHAQSMSEQYCR